MPNPAVFYVLLARTRKLPVYIDVLPWTVYIQRGSDTPAMGPETDKVGQSPRVRTNELSSLDIDRRTGNAVKPLYYVDTGDQWRVPRICRNATVVIVSGTLTHSHQRNRRHVRES